MRQASQVVLAALSAVCGTAAPVHAYRPFDGTDADVAEAGEVELELGLAGARLEGRSASLIVPSMIWNVGLGERAELVVEGSHEVVLAPDPEMGRSRLAEPAVGLKIVWRAGRLQGRTGPSLATEFHVGLPEPGTEQALGASVIGILSHELGAWTIHANLAGGIEPEGAFALEGNLILELPRVRGVRPVFEAVVEWAEGDEGVLATGLLGLHYEVTPSVVLDAAVVAGWSHGTYLAEARAGLTVAVPFFHPGP